jgi:hypothetical protein
LGCGLLLTLGGCNLILNLDEAAPTADASAGGAGGSGGSTASDASFDRTASNDVSVKVDAPVGDEADAIASFDVANGGDAVAPRDVSGERDASALDASVDADSGAVLLDARPEAEAGPPPILACAVQQVLGTGTPLATGTTVGGANNFTGSCGSGTANDIAFDWIVPVTDYYAVSTTGSSFDTVLYLRDAACNGPELACNNNTATTPQSEIVSHFNQGQRVLAVVDGNVGDQGTVAFNAERVTCPAIDLAGQPLPATLSTVGGTNTHTGPCGGANQLERTYRFTPTQSGLYSITAQSTAFPPILYVEQGPRCGGALLGCNKGNGFMNSYPAEVMRYLTAGQPVTITVDGGGTGDGGSGFFTLNAQRVVDDAGTCGSVPLPMDGSTITIPGYGSSHSTASCALAGNLDTVGSGPYPFADLTYQLVVNNSISESCRYTVDANGPFTLYVIQNACSGSETRCVVATMTGPAAMPYEAFFSMSMVDNGTYTVVVENGSFFPLTFTVSVGCIA